MLTRLRHRTIRRTHHQDRTVHLRRTRDHVLHVVSMPRAIHVRVVTVRRLVFHVRRVDRNPARLLFRRRINIRVRHRLRATSLRQHHRDRRRQRRLAMVNVTNRSNVAVRLVTFKFLFGHLGPAGVVRSRGEKCWSG